MSVITDSGAITVTLSEAAQQLREANERRKTRIAKKHEDVKKRNTDVVISLLSEYFE
jgi:hypothetical protein